MRLAVAGCAALVAASCDFDADVRTYCANTGRCPDAGAPDSGPGSDSGIPADAGKGADAGPSGDAGQTSDAGPGSDAGPRADAGPARDAGGFDGGSCFAVFSTTSISVLPSAASVALADIDGDGILDIAISNSANPGAVAFYRGDGLGGFTAQTTYAAVPYATRVVVADLNRDGRPDVAIAGSNAGTCNCQSLLVLRGEGGFTFSDAGNLPIAANHYPVDLAVADLNGDGWLDVAVVDQVPSLTIFSGSATTIAAAGTVPLAGANAHAMVWGDLNGDGAADLVTSESTTGHNIVGVALGHLTGLPGPDMTYTAGPTPLELALGDLDGDGHLDLVTSTGVFTAQWSVLLGQSNGAFGSPVTQSLGLGSEITGPVAIADLNGDGYRDVIVASGTGSGTSHLSFVPGVGNGTFGAQTVLDVSTSPVIGLAIGDINRDGRLDMATITGFPQNSMTIWLNQCGPAGGIQCVGSTNACDGGVACCSGGACVAGVCP